MTKCRLDEYLVSRQLAASRNQAADLIRRQLVKVNGHLGRKPGQPVDPEKVRVQVLKTELFVSRGGDKLAAAAKFWSIDWRGRTVADIGCGVGGFSDCALRGGAERVLAADVGREQLAARLQADPRLSWLPKTDARRLVWPDGWPPADWILIDLSFISLRQVLPQLAHLGRDDSHWLVLAKPQFESAGWQLNKGVVKNSRQRREILVAFESWLAANDWRLVGKKDADLAGAKGNLECFYRLQKPRPN